MARPRPTTKAIAPIALCAGIGLLICAYANALSRQLLDPNPLIFWAGVLVIALPIFYRLTSRDASPAERLMLVCLLGLSLYGVKLVRDAPIFTFSDEVVHAFNAEQIAVHHRLFSFNPILPVTPSYPGLEGATSALMTITGLSSYWAGAVVVGAARLSLMAALFLLYSRVSGSARTAGIAVAIYAANFNFLYWGAQFSYESLSLPIFVVVLMAIAERETVPHDWARSWAVPIVLGISAIVVTHHLTSYALAAFLAGLALAYWLVRRDWRWPNPWRYAIFTAALASVWLLLVANSTFGYLSPVLGDAFKAIFDTASGEAPPRGLFQGKGSTVPATPLLARAVALAAVGLLAAAAPLGLLRLWQRSRRKPFVLIFGVAAIAFFMTLGLRLAPAAWETGNRAGEFLFIGLAFVVASAGVQNWAPLRRPWLGRVMLSAALGVVLIGGAISGWPWDLQLTSPLRASAEGRTISSPPLALAEWAREETLAEDRFGASISDARLLMAPGERIAFAGKNPDIQDMLLELTFSTENWEMPMLRENGIRYVVTDSREIASDSTRGYPLSVGGEPTIQRQAILKFSQLPGARRIYSNGEISVYDLGAHP
jgi:hypothetical protein